MEIPKLSKYERNFLTREELKLHILFEYYPHYKSKKRQEIFENPWKNDYKRDMIETKIKDGNNSVSTIVFSINGTPPKGIAVFFSDNIYNDEISGQLVIFGNDKNKKPKHYFHVTLTD